MPPRFQHSFVSLAVAKFRRSEPRKHSGMSELSVSIEQLSLFFVIIKKLIRRSYMLTYLQHQLGLLRCLGQCACLVCQDFTVLGSSPSLLPSAPTNRYSSLLAESVKAFRPALQTGDPLLVLDSLIAELSGQRRECPFYSRESVTLLSIIHCGSTIRVPSCECVVVTGATPRRHETAAEFQVSIVHICYSFCNVLTYDQFPRAG